MTKQMYNISWLEVIIFAMKKLGGQAKYKDLYSTIEHFYPEKISSVKNFKAQVRETIEKYSSD